MKKSQNLICILSLLIFTSFFIIVSSLHANQSQNFDQQKVKQLIGHEKKSKSEVENLFGKPTKSTSIKKTDEGCIELWIYVEVVLNGS